MVEAARCRGSESLPLCSPSVVNAVSGKSVLSGHDLLAPKKQYHGQVNRCADAKCDLASTVALSDFRGRYSRGSQLESLERTDREGLSDGRRGKPEMGLHF